MAQKSAQKSTPGSTQTSSTDATRRNKQAERRARMEEELRLQRARERRRSRLVIAGVVALVVVIGAVVGVVVSQRGSGGSAHDSASADGSQIVPAAPSGSTTVQQTPQRVANPTGIKGVLAWNTEGWPGDGSSHAGALQHDHVTGRVTYAVTPPVGGPHNPVWMNAGVYTKPVPSERAVHNLEHGAVWITYRPDLPAAEVKQLVAFVDKQSMIDEGNGQANRYLDLSPWADDKLPSPIVMSSWGYQLRLTSPTDPRMQEFVNELRHSPTYTPEYGAAVDGVPVQTGGDPAEDGSKQPNPAGTADSGGMS